MTENPLIVGIDGSPAAREALRWASRLAMVRDREVVAVHALGLLETLDGQVVSADGHRAEIEDLVRREWCGAVCTRDIPLRVVVLEGDPVVVLLAVAIAVAAYLLVRYTALGEQIIAVGGNEEAARLSGINTDRVKICVYCISGLLSSIAGFVLIGRVGAAEPIGGNGFELQAIGAAVIGGASLFGGEGNPLGSLIGALTLGAMQNGLTLMNVPSFWQFVATGAVVILAVFVDQSTRQRQ